MINRFEQGPFPGKCTVHGSAYWPDTTLGGQIGGKPPYKGADIVCTAPAVYGKVLDLLLAPYCDAPNQGEILQGLAQVLTEDEAEVWIAFPDYSHLPEDPAPETVKRVAERVRPELATNMQSLVSSLIEKEFLIPMGEREGEPVYMRTYLLYLVSSYAGREGSPLYEAVFHWFYNIIRGNSADMRKIPKSGNVMIAMPNEVAITGDDRHGKVPMNIEIPDDRMVIDFDRTSEIINNAWCFALAECVCRASTEHEHDRECDHTIQTCVLFDKTAEVSIRMGWAEPKTKEEIEEVIKACRNEGLVQMTYNAEHPTSICNCCKCCCVFLNSLKRGETTIAGPSRFVPARLDGCRSCGQCASICPMEAIRISDEGACIDTMRCIGCGLCVTKCNFGALKLETRIPGDTSSNRACDYQKRDHI